jgi:hypothetical protein
MPEILHPLGYPVLEDLISFDRPSNRRSARGLHHPKEVQYDEYNSDNDQSVNPTACTRDPLTYVSTEKAEQPQYD